MQPAYAPYQPANPPETPILGAVGEIDRFTDSDRATARNGHQEHPLRLPPDRTQPRQNRLSLRPVWRGRILLTLNQLAVMSQNGIEIADALEMVARNCRDNRLAASLAAIHESVSAGQPLSHAVSTHGVYFPATLAPMLAAAEASGDVPETLGRVCSRMRGELQMRASIVGALIYPAILIAASSVVMAALVFGVLPQFGKVFVSMGRPIPIYTQVLLSFGAFCQNHWLALLIAIVASLAGLFILRRHFIIQGPLQRALTYGPWIRDAYRPLQAGRVLRTVASMVQGGVPLLQAVQLTQRTTTDASWQNLLRQIEANLIDGSTASRAMHNVDFIPLETAQLMLTAERTGRVPEVLEDIGAFYEEEAQRRIKRLVVAFEPAIIIVMGVFVAAVVMSVMLPLLDVSTIG